MATHTYRNSLDQPGIKGANPACAQLNMEHKYLSGPVRASQFPRWRPYIHLNRHTPSGQSRVYRVTQRTDGIHCRESAGTRPVNLKVVPNECCLGRSLWTNYYAPLLLTPTIGMKWACSKYRRWLLYALIHSWYCNKRYYQEGAETEDIYVHLVLVPKIPNR